MPQRITPYPTREDLGEAFADRFDRLLDKSQPIKPGMTSPCWLWTRAADGKGYGVIGIKRKVRLCHRLAYVLRHGSIPQELLLHECDTPRCCNPDHLHLGDHGKNMAEGVARGVFRRAFGASNQNARLSDQQAAAIREGHAAGKTIGRLARDHNVSWPTARKVVEGKSYPLRTDRESDAKAALVEC